MARTRSLCIVVPRQVGEATRKKLSELGLLERGLHIKREADALVIPIRERPARGELDADYPTREEEFEPKGPRYRSYKDAVEGVPKELLVHLPTSFDVVGDVAIVKVPDELAGHAKAIADAMLKATPSVRAVAWDRGVQGETRIRDLEQLAGEGTLETVHREHGLRFEVDLAKCYFSPRLATERHRVAGLVRDGERVLDMFTGVGPFAVLIAATRKVDKLWAVDINETAVRYLRRNIERNGVQGIEPVCGDAREFVRTVEPVDRVIMNLPHSSWEFLPDAMAACANDATIHYYEITTDPEPRARAIEALAGQLGRSAKVVSTREVRTYSRTESHWAFDVRVYVGVGCSVQAK